MEKRRFGKTELELSILGFGAMRLPGFDTRKYDKVMDGAVELMRKGIEGGINYLDTAYIYNEGMSEKAVGLAVKGRREDVVISDKIQPVIIRDADHFEKLIEQMLGRLDTSYMDIFYFHGLGLKEIDMRLREKGLLDRAEKLRSQGLIRHIGFSSHDKPERVIEMIKTGLFEGMLVQYNYVDMSYAEAIALAHKSGMGVALMGPVGGGRLSGMGAEFNRLIPESLGNAPELALRFAWSNLNVTSALSGMNRMEDLEANLALADSFKPLDGAEWEDVKRLQEAFEELKSIYCTGCGYCVPCEQGVKIPQIFHALIAYKVFNSPEYAKVQYNFMLRNNRADKCIECGECEEKCPQEINIMEQLKETHKLLTG